MAFIDPKKPVATGVVFHDPDGARAVFPCLELDHIDYRGTHIVVHATAHANARGIRALMLTNQVPDPIFHTLAATRGLAL